MHDFLQHIPHPFTVEYVGESHQKVDVFLPKDLYHVYVCHDLLVLVNL